MVNGGYYYEPHVVSKILSPDGTTIKNIEPRLLKQTISASTSEKIVDYCNGVVTEGTGTTARPAGYAIGGKTGTAEMVPRTKRDYVCSFMGYAPADDPQIAIYVVVDRPNSAKQDDAKYATRIVRGILTEVLPYLHYFMTEELSEDETTEISQSGLAVQAPGIEPAEGEEGSEGDPQDPEELEITGREDGEEGVEEMSEEEREWRERIAGYETDPETGYLIEPETGVKIDPVTGQAVESVPLMD